MVTKNRLSKRLEEERNDLIILGNNSGMTASDIAALLNMSIQRVYQIIKVREQEREKELFKKFKPRL